MRDRPPTGILVTMNGPERAHAPHEPRTFLSMAALIGMLIGAFGSGLQYIADPDRFSHLSPGISFIIGATALFLLGERWWMPPVAAAGVGLWIITAATLSTKLSDNLGVSGDDPMIGGIVMLVGAAITAVAGAAVMVQRCRTAHSGRETIV